jgi:hypothetical protein
MHGALIMLFSSVFSSSLFFLFSFLLEGRKDEHPNVNPFANVDYDIWLVSGWKIDQKTMEI